MIKRLLRILSVSLILPFAISGQLFAFNPAPAVSLVACYAKSGGNYDVVAKSKSGSSFDLYVNDKNPVKATANKQSYITFHKVKLSANG